MTITRSERHGAAELHDESQAADSPAADSPTVEDPAAGRPAVEAEPAAAEEPSGPGPPTPAKLVYVDPRTLIVDANGREKEGLDKQFVGSVKDLGVLVPISARRVATEDGEQLRVILGQRRTRAAVEAGLARVPVFVVDAPDDEKAAEIARIIEQIVENDQRAALPDPDRVAAHQQLALLGLSAGQIARRTRTGVKTVKTSLAVAGSELAAAAMHRYGLTLDQAAVIAEFEGDAEAVKALTVAAAREPAQFEHVAQRARDQRAAARAREAAVAELAAAGVRVVEDPGYGDATSTVRRLSRLRSTGGDDGEEMTVEEHAGCSGHAAYLHESPAWAGPVTYEPVYVCTDWRAAGQVDRFGFPAGSGSGSGAAPAGGGMSEEQKQERRQVIANNEAWASAQTVRRTWLRTFLARRSAPKDAPQLIAATLASGTHEIRRAMEDGHTLACELLGATTDGWRRWGGGVHPIEELAVTATPARAGVLSLGLVLAGIESTLDRTSWRGAGRTTRSYLTALERWGYPLSDVERMTATDPQRTDEQPAVDDGASGAGEDGTGDDAGDGVGGGARRDGQDEDGSEPASTPEQQVA